MSDNHKTTTSRRGVLAAMATVGGGLILRSLATGLPAQILLNPLSASAQDMPTGKILILSSSSAGDPVNANVPGTYGLPNLFHSADPAMAATTLSLGGQSYTAAKPWADLPQTILDRSVFFHHATYTPVHGEMNRVQRMMDATEKNDMLVSLIARELGPTLGTVQHEPVSLGARGGELLSSGGRILSNVAPLSVRQSLGGVDGPLKDLQTLRDKSIDKIYALYKEQGTPSQLKLLDAWSRSRDEVRAISTELITLLDTVDGNDQVNQARTAAVLAAMKISPVISLHLDFGGDNHTDAGFDNETTKHLSAIATLQGLIEQLDQLRTAGNLQNDVVFASLNVFGRTLKKKGTAGRDHHSGHHAMVLIGEGLNPGVVGGVALNESGSEYIAQSIDSSTGEAGGDIPYEETLGAAGKTLAVALGIPEDRANQMLPPGKIVSSVLSG
jgi:hypothetical protein